MFQSIKDKKTPFFRMECLENGARLLIIYYTDYESSRRKVLTEPNLNPRGSLFPVL